MLLNSSARLWYIWLCFEFCSTSRLVEIQNGARFQVSLVLSMTWKEFRKNHQCAILEYNSSKPLKAVRLKSSFSNFAITHQSAPQPHSDSLHETEHTIEYNILWSCISILHIFIFTRSFI